MKERTGRKSEEAKRQSNQAISDTSIKKPIRREDRRERGRHQGTTVRRYLLIH